MASQVFWSMSVHISQRVREQPDTGYWKILRLLRFRVFGGGEMLMFFGFFILG